MYPPSPQATGASIQVASEMLPNSTERAVTVSGTADAITECIKYVCGIMLEVSLMSRVSCMCHVCVMSRVCVSCVSCMLRVCVKSVSPRVLRAEHGPRESNTCV